MINDILSREQHDIGSLREIMAVLRSENGCPWDREQTHRSIRNDFIEETYEAVEAIDTENSKLLREELGDVLLQIVFHSQIEEENGTFTFDDVVNDICKKLIHRHPHVFGEVSVMTSDDVLDSWDQIKKEEKKEERSTVTDELRSVPVALPALMRAQKIGKKAGKVGFDFSCTDETLDKVREEIDEVSVEISKSVLDHEKIDEEIGDLLLAVTNVARFTGVDCEKALCKACDKFITRFEGVEKSVLSRGKLIFEMTDSELLSLWNIQKCKK